MGRLWKKVAAAIASAAVGSVAAGQLVDGAADGYSIFGWSAPEILSPYEQDRATVTPSADVVPVGRFVLEAGATVTYDDEDGVETTNLTTPELLLRAGIFERTEFRLGWDGYSSTEIDTTGFNDTISGGTDMTAGVKVELLDNDGAIPGLAILGQVSIPVGDEEITSDRVDPSAQVVVSYDEIDDFWRFDASAELSFLEDTTDDSFTEVGVAAGSRQRWQEGFESFLEYFGFFRDADGIPDAQFIQGGVIFEASTNIILDARIGAGLTSDSADMFAGAGISFSF
ncbi:MAG: transporter [Planctomycetota bacterium]